jgi:hypothetical protein
VNPDAWNANPAISAASAGRTTLPPETEAGKSTTEWL